MISTYETLENLYSYWMFRDKPVKFLSFVRNSIQYRIKNNHAFTLKGKKKEYKFGTGLQERDKIFYVEISIKDDSVNIKHNTSLLKLPMHIHKANPEFADMIQHICGSSWKVIKKDKQGWPKINVEYIRFVGHPIEHNKHNHHETNSS